MSLAAADFATRDRLVAVVCEEIVDALLLRLSTADRATLALAGGTTPAPLYRALGGVYAPWDRIDITLTDERWTAPDSDHANEQLVRDTLLQGRAIQARFHPLLSDAPDAEAAARAADPRIARLRPIACAVVGFGTDGHVASLFPGADAPSEGNVVAVHAAGAAGAQERLSLTLPVLCEAGHIWLIAFGPEKRARYEAAKRGDGSPLARLIEAASGRFRACFAP